MIVIIRDARTSEHQALSKLAWDAKASWGYPRAWLAEWSDQLTLTPEYIRANRVFVAELDGAPVGLLALEPGPPPEIGHLWVHPQHQAEGVGRILMEQALKVAAEQGWTDLQIVSDPNAVPFYEKCGAFLVGALAAPVLGEERSLPILQLPVVER